MKVAPFLNITLLNAEDPTTPYLSNITTGNMMKASLIFHTKSHVIILNIQGIKLHLTVLTLDVYIIDAVAKQH